MEIMIEPIREGHDPLEGRKPLAPKRWYRAGTPLKAPHIAVLAFGLLFIPTVAASAASSDDDAFRRALEGGNNPQSELATPKPRPKKVKRQTKSVSVPSAMPAFDCVANFNRLREQDDAEATAWSRNVCGYRGCSQAQLCDRFRGDILRSNKRATFALLCKSLPNQQAEIQKAMEWKSTSSRLLSERCQN